MIRILLFLITYFGFENKPKADLRKKTSLADKVNSFIVMYRFELLLIITITFMVFFVLALVFWFPAMDPYTNRFNEVI